MRRALLWAAAVIVACGGSGNDQFGGDGGNGDASGGDGGGSQDGAVTFGDSGAADSGPAPDAGTTEVDYVYAHSPTVLYKVDPVQKTMTTVGNFSSNCANENVIDIAVDANNNGYATTFQGFYKLDLTTAKCTLVKQGSYPNSLSFVPAGTLDPNVEALVGYVGSTYVRIDTASGNITNVGAVNGYTSSGDIVSVKGGGTFLTVVGDGSGDDLLQVDPKTGNMIQNYGSINHVAVYGLAFWAGTAYGFDEGGQLFSIGWVNNKLVTTDIPTTPGLVFYGAGSTTSAPATDSDGGGIPVN